MSLALTGGVAVAYVVGVVGIHRYAVHRRRALAGFYPTLRWLDWDTLLEGVAPKVEPTGAPLLAGPKPPEGGPPPRVLGRPAGSPHRTQFELLDALVAGVPVDEERFEPAGFSGGDARWLGALSRLRSAPEAVLRGLEEVAPRSTAEAYLREILVLEREATPVNLELVSFAAKRRIAQALVRFGEHPALFFARARASSLLGFNAAVLDDLARAVYFSREAPFYLRAVTEHAWIADARPALFRACRAVAERTSAAGTGELRSGAP